MRPNKLEQRMLLLPILLLSGLFHVACIADHAIYPPDVTVSLTPRLSTGGGYACYVAADDTAWCWGNNADGQLGNGTTSSSSVPVQITGLSSVTAIATGWHHTCAIKVDGTVWCWGENRSGELGNGTSQNSLIPVQVNGIAAADEISVGGHHSCALSAGQIWCWGSNARGELGTGQLSGPEQCGPQTDESCSRVPVQVTQLAGVLQVDAGMMHTCAILGDQTVWCWGFGEDGQIGDSSVTAQPTPVQIPVVAGAVLITVTDQSCVLTQNGDGWCWGPNPFGEVASGDDLTRDHPTTIDTPPFSSFSAGRNHSCGVRPDRSIRCWGANYQGELGDGSSSNSRPEGTQVAGIDDAISVSAGQAFTCALRADDSVWCWGANGEGALGDGTRTDRLTPVQVLGLP